VTLSEPLLPPQACEPCEPAAEDAADAEKTAYEELACCNICAEGDWEDDNQIIFCDSCDLAVHQVQPHGTWATVQLSLTLRMRAQVCYGAGARDIPEGDQPWFCDMCRFARRSGASSTRVEQDCILCPEKGGAMKRTTDSRWAHIT